MKPIPWPAARPLKIYATDPTKGYEPALKISIPVDYEPLKPGPYGERLEIVDYDGYAKTFYDAVDLDDPTILIQGGLDPSEGDPRFHQQMVYAVASRTLSNFDRALGRRVDLKRGSRRSRLRLLPHAFRGRNAFYDHELHAILFGYFNADSEEFGPNVANQKIYTCLSHDIIAHEMTHAIVDRLRRHFLEPTNVDVPAFHEGFSDLVALFQHFSFPNLLAREIRRNRGNLTEPTVLVQLAEQFGYATGGRQPLRSAIGDPKATLQNSGSEAHERGAVLVAAVFDGFFETYRTRISDIVRIATGGSGLLPPGELQPYLADRIANEAARAAQRQLDMCIRAFDYMPPVDITFGDFLRAMVTADFELNPDDEWGQRSALIEGFRRRGIYPEGVLSLAEESLRWPVASSNLPPLTDSLSTLLPQLLAIDAQRFSQRSRNAELAKRAAMSPRPSLGDFDDDKDAGDQQGIVRSLYEAMATSLNQYAVANAAALFLRPDLMVQVTGFHAAFRTATNGGLLIELVAQLTQIDPKGATDAILGPIAVRGGTTIVVGIDGHVRYAIAKPLPGPYLTGGLAVSAAGRPARQTQFMASLEAQDPLLPYMNKEQLKARMNARMSIRALHGGAGA